MKPLRFYRKANIRPNEQNDYNPVAAKRFCSQLDQFTFHFPIDKIKITSSVEKKSVLPTAELKQIITENLSEGGVQTKSNQVTPNLKPIGQIIIFEFDFQEFQEFQKQKQRRIHIKKFRQKIIIEADNFWTNNDFLIKKYQLDVQQFQEIKDQNLFFQKEKKQELKIKSRFSRKIFLQWTRKSYHLYLTNHKILKMLNQCMNALGSIAIKICQIAFKPFNSKRDKANSIQFAVFQLNTLKIRFIQDFLIIIIGN